MSNFYPIWWDTTLTIYNRQEDPQTQLISWYRHTVSNCFWKYVGDKVRVGETVLETNSIICRIPKSDTFVEKYEWVNIPNDKKQNYFTLSPRDIIVRGEVLDEIDEYASNQRSSDLIEKYKALQGAMEIETVSINTGIGRGSEHYLVRGI